MENVNAGAHSAQNWWENAPCEQEVLDKGIDPDVSLIAYNPIPCDDAGHANEFALCALREDWTCHYEGCQSVITARKVNETLKAFLHSNLDLGKLSVIGYTAEELNDKMARKINLLRLGMKIGKFGIRTTAIAPSPHEGIVRRGIREEQNQHVRHQNQIFQKRMIIAVCISALAFIYFEILLPYYNKESRDPFQEETCPS